MPVADVSRPPVHCIYTFRDPVLLLLSRKHIFSTLSCLTNRSIFTLSTFHLFHLKNACLTSSAESTKIKLRPSTWTSTDMKRSGQPVRIPFWIQTFESGMNLLPYKVLFLIKEWFILQIKCTSLSSDSELRVILYWFYRRSVYLHVNRRISE